MPRTLPPTAIRYLLADSGFTINIAFFKDPKYDALKDFDPISVVAETPYILVVNPGLSYSSSIKDFIAAAKAQPGKLTIGSAGSGSGTHMTGELFRLRAGINMIHVPYKSVGPALSDVVAGQIQSTISTRARYAATVKSRTRENSRCCCAKTQSIAARRADLRRKRR